MPEVEEDGDTFEANARKKASEAAKFTRQWVLAEDSGLVVPVLNGRPGVCSARYAGKQGDDPANNAKTARRAETARKAEQAGLLHLRRGGRPGRHGACRDGRPLPRTHHPRAARAARRFGYDPLFLIPEYHRTFGELSLPLKQAREPPRTGRHAAASALRGFSAEASRPRHES
jgi:XTP/dITP diphosphohydrolase